jgi:hypothetical protein
MTLDSPRLILRELRARHREMLAAMLSAREEAEVPEPATRALGHVLAHLDWYEEAADPAVFSMAGQESAFLELVEGLRRNAATLRYECVSFLRASWESPRFGREHRQRFLSLASRVQARADREESLVLWLLDAARDPSGEWAQPEARPL